ncbi:MAG TPA: CHC2 zinc finger domain-containing protein [Pirellulales bacterium]|nr:CHC2 zinc finger domain-containing protein [Pirellulales bacterium]
MNKDDAKNLLRIPEIWSRFNLPGKPAKSCPSPFRDDKNPSFSVSADGLLWNDFATGQGGDAIDFLAQLTGAGTFTKVASFIELAASIYGDASRVMPSPGRIFPKPKVYTPEPEPDELKAALEALKPPSDEDCRIIAVCRGLDPFALYIAGRIGTLLVGKVGGFDCWVLTDQRRRCAEARRFDGDPFPAIGSLGERKAHTLRGSKKDWPIGVLPRLENHQKIRRILFVEGGPDYLAAMHVITTTGDWNCLPVAVLGAACAKNGFHPDAADLLRRRRVRIVQHNGASAANSWRAALDAVGCEVDIVEPHEPRAKDLNDLVRLKSADELLEILP